MIWPSQVREFKKKTQGEFVGVGIQIRSEPSGDLLVVSPLPGGPALASGVKAGDVITHIDGKAAHGISDYQAVEVITGNPGTTVALRTRSLDGTVTEHELVRQEIRVSSVLGWKQRPGAEAEGSWDWMLDPEAKVAYMRLKGFQKTTGDELKRAVAEARRDGARGMILDLRYNPGGLVGSSVEVADTFLRGGEIVSTRGDRQAVAGQGGRPQAGQATRRQSFRADRQRDDVDLPMIVLVNGYSASASEIVSGALSDHGRALVVGERTFGKGSVQMLFDLGGQRAGSDVAWLKLTISHYYLPSGRNIHKEELDTEWGVDPDVVVEMTPRQMTIAQRARQAMDVLREEGESATVQVEPGEDEVDAETALLETDAQLSAALLLLRVRLAGEVG